MGALVPGALARFQDAFARALLSPGGMPASEVAAIAAQPAFAVYRNTVMKGCVDALGANYPAVARLVGEEWFRAAAAIYVRQNVPTDPTLLHYGASFADFLATFAPAAELPYLPGVARLDRMWTEAHAALDESPLDPAAITAFDHDALAQVILRPHAAARWAAFAEGPVYTIWSRNRSDAEPDGDINWRPEGALLTRPRDTVESRAFDAAGCAFLDACASGRTVGAAVEAALGMQQDTDFAQLMSTLLASGAIGRVTVTSGQHPEEDQP